ncbi:MAG: branched-chain amino acid ABC transporter permease, partial [Actinobacteria bacterium]
MIEDRSIAASVDLGAEAAAGAPGAAAAGRTRWFVLGALCLLLLVLPLGRSVIGPYNYVLQLLTITLMWIAMTSSWNIIGGFASYISLGHGVFMGIGGYTSGLLLVHYGLSPFLTAVLGGLAAVAVGALAGLITLRTRGPAFIITTIALLLMFRLWFDNWEVLGGSNGLTLPLPPFSVDWLRAPFYYAMLLTAAGAVYLSYRVAHSKFGLGLRAIAQDETKAEVSGVPTRMYKVLAFALSAFFVGVAGA